MNKETINLDTTSIEEIINNINSKINVGGSFNKSSALSSFSCLTNAGIGGKLIGSICDGLESMNSCINQITKDLKEYSEAQETVDDEIIEASTPFKEDFNNETLFSPVSPAVKGTESTNTEKVVSTYSENIEVEKPSLESVITLTDIKTPSVEEITEIANKIKEQDSTELTNIVTQPAEEITSVSSEELISSLNNHYITQINNGTYQDLIDFEYDTLNLTKSLISNVSQNSSYSELLNHELSIFREYLEEICSKLNISSISKLTDNEELLNTLIKNYESNNVNVKLSSYSNDLIISKLNSIN